MDDEENFVDIKDEEFEEYDDDDNDDDEDDAPSELEPIEEFDELSEDDESLDEFEELDEKPKKIKSDHGHESKKNKPPLTEAQIQEHMRKRRNSNSRRRYKLKQMESFLVEYSKICEKYGCLIRSYYDAHIAKQKRS